MNTSSWKSYGDRLAEMHFRTTPEGRVVYPFGVFGGGYLVDAASERRLKDGMLRGYAVSAVLVPVAIVVVRLVPFPASLVVILLPVLAYTVWWRRLVAGLGPSWQGSPTRMTVRDALRGYAVAQPLPLLVTGAVGAAVLALASIVALILSRDAPADRLWTIAGSAALWSAGTAFLLHLIGLRRTRRGGP